MTTKRSGAHLLATVAAVAVLNASGHPALAQSGPPVNGTLALEASVKGVYHALNVIIVETREGVVQTYRLAKGLVVHGSTAPDPLVGLRTGTTVVLHYEVSNGDPSVIEIDRIAADGLASTEGMVTRIDRKKRVIAVRLDAGRVEEFELTAEAASTAGPDAKDRVRVYYTDDLGRKVVHYFRSVPAER